VPAVTAALAAVPPLPPALKPTGANSTLATAAFPDQPPATRTVPSWSSVMVLALNGSIREGPFDQVLVAGS
jgi:hypothetical protein